MASVRDAAPWVGPSGSAKLPEMRNATAAPRARHPRPVHRPPVAIRAVAALLGVMVLLFNAALMLSDRAPALLRLVGGDLVRRASERIDAGERVSQVASDARVADGDALVHIVVWALAIVLVGLAVWTWRGLVIGAIAVWICSTVVEFGQDRWTDTRSAQRDDILANLVGVGLGTAAVALCYLCWSAVAVLRFRDGSHEATPSRRHESSA